MTQEGKPSLQQIRKMSQPQNFTLTTKRGGGDSRQRGDTERICLVHQLPRDRHSHSRSCRKPYSDILAQTNNLYSEDDDSISEYSSKYGYDRAHSDSASEVHFESGSAERYSPEPRHRRSRARSSRP
ncbi:unnamed protein product [Pleuronectes platessa]|uniref:Uncharacterized protein n=1 Tax=Pleuronectes platessa TaxID=8262 RepID=A0A9N7V067_PLEPL|nr:unnamed protein product [Pleuronectes platessa]